MKIRRSRLNHIKVCPLSMTCLSVDIFNVYQLLYYSPGRPDPQFKSPAPTNLSSINVSPLSSDLRKFFLVDSFSRPRFSAVSVVGRQQMAPSPLLPRLLNFGLAFQVLGPPAAGRLRDRLGSRPSFTMISPSFPLPEPELIRRGEASKPNAHGLGLRRLQVYFRSVKPQCIWVGCQECVHALFREAVVCIFVVWRVRHRPGYSSSDSSTEHGSKVGFDSLL